MHDQALHGRLVLALGNYTLRATQVESDEKSVELDLGLTKTIANSDEQQILIHRFRINRGKAVLLGVSAPTQTLVIVLQLKSEPIMGE